MVTDFGMSRVLEAQEGQDAHRTMSNLGPVRWMAPESLSKREYSTASDVYMFGSFLYELAVLDVPFHGVPVEEVITLVTKNGMHPPIPKTCPGPLADCMRLAWNPSPKLRPSMQDLFRKLTASTEYAPSGTHDSRSMQRSARKQVATSQQSGEYAAMSDDAAPSSNYGAMVDHEAATPETNSDADEKDSEHGQYHTLSE